MYFVYFPVFSLQFVVYQNLFYVFLEITLTVVKLVFFQLSKIQKLWL